MTAIRHVAEMRFGDFRQIGVAVVDGFRETAGESRNFHGLTSRIFHLDRFHDNAGFGGRGIKHLDDIQIAHLSIEYDLQAFMVFEITFGYDRRPLAARPSVISVGVHSAAFRVAQPAGVQAVASFDLQFQTTAYELEIFGTRRKIARPLFDERFLCRRYRHERTEQESNERTESHDAFIHRFS